MSTVKLLHSNYDDDTIRYAVDIPRIDMVSMDFPQSIRDRMSLLERDGARISDVLRLLGDIVEVIEVGERVRQMDKIYVDHICENLEKNSAGDIIRFLAKYAGWQTLINFAIQEDMKKHNQVK